MNISILMGRLTSDPILRYTSSNKACVRFNIAINRNYKSESGEKTADFISIVAWGNQAETIANYFKKGSRIALTGRIQNNNYTKEDGSKIYNTDVVIEHFSFVDYKKAEDTSEPEENDPFLDFGDNVTLTDDDLPF